MSLIPKLNPDKSVVDIAAAIDFAAKATGKKVGVIGYCFGGTLAWLAATRLHPAAAVGYYGGRIGNYAARKTRPARSCSTSASQDAHIPAEEVEKVHSAHPEVEIYLVRRRPRLQLRCSRQLQRRCSQRSPPTLARISQKTSGLIAQISRRVPSVDQSKDKRRESLFPVPCLFTAPPAAPLRP